MPDAMQSDCLQAQGSSCSVVLWSFLEKNSVHSVDFALGTHSARTKGGLTNPRDIPSLTLFTQKQNSLILILCNEDACPKQRNPSDGTVVVVEWQFDLRKEIVSLGCISPNRWMYEGSLCTSKPFC